MAQSFIQWDSPIINSFDVDIDMLNFFEDFDQKMQLAGLIKDVENSVAYQKPTPVQDNSNGKYYLLCELAYKLPKGVGKVEYEDITGKSYKRVKRASYYKTDTEIKFKFLYIKATNSGISITDPNYFSKTCFLIADLLVRNTKGSDYILCSNMGTYYTWSSSANFNVLPTNTENRTNYIVHTEDTLIVAFGVIKYDGNISGYFVPKQATINFALKRSQTDNCFSVFYPEGRRLSTSPEGYHFLATCKNNSFYQIQKNDTVLNFNTWAHRQADDNIEGELVLTPMIANQYGVKESFYGFMTTKSVPQNAITTDENTVILYNDVPVITGCLFFGDYSRSFKITNGSYSTVFGLVSIKPTHEVITGDLT